MNIKKYTIISYILKDRISYAPQKVFKRYAFFVFYNMSQPNFAVFVILLTSSTS